MSERQSRMLPEPEAAALLGTYGIAYPAHAYVLNEAEAVKAAERLGFPVVLKVVSPDAMHKSDVGGVAVSIQGTDGVEPAYEAIVQSVRSHVPDARILGMLVCQQAQPGLEVIVGGLQDAMFGPAL
ncbi:MAG: acetate--CoA ligase family protein, partial [Anaerolineae bacterium]